MSTRRAKRHESDVIVNSGHRKWLKIWDHQGFGSKWRMEASGRAPKFRTRAYNRAKEIENKSLKTEPLGLVRCQSILAKTPSLCGKYWRL